MDLKNLARSKGTNLKRIAEESGIPPTTLYAISRGDTNFDNVGISTAIKVANALGMTVEELYSGDNAKLSTMSFSSDKMTFDELELLQLYRRMDDADKSTFLDMARSLAFAGDVKKKDARGAASRDFEIVSGS